MESERVYTDEDSKEEGGNIQEAFEPLARIMKEVPSLYEEASVRHVTETLRNIDYEQLYSIFSEHRVRSGVTAEDSGFIRSDHIYISEQVEKSVAWFDQKTGEITFSPKLMARMLKDPESDLGRFTLSVLTHEETHASGNNVEPGGFDAFMKKLRARFREWGSEDFSESGYTRDRIVGGGFMSDFVYFNEGVTDMIAAEVYDEYLRRSGDRVDIISDSHDSSFIEGYPGSRKLLGAFISRMADAVGIPPDKVWEALKQGYFSGVNLGDTSLAQFFNDTYFPGFLYDVNDIDVKKRTALPGKYIEPDPEVQIDRIIARLCIKPLPENASKYFEEFMQKINQHG